MQILFSGGRLFDGTRSANNHAVLVENGKVKDVGPAGQFHGYEGKRVDTSLGTLLPGLIDCHVHLIGGAEADPVAAEARLSHAELALKVLARAQETLAGGIVAVRDCGGRDYVELAVRDSINRGSFSGPRIRACGRLICMTGGHGNQMGRIADGPTEVVKAVREQIHAGVDAIKMIATGGVMTRGVNPEDAHYSAEEMAAGLAEARRFGKRSASHAQGAQGILNATLAGVSSIEHGFFMDQRCIDAMLERGTFLVPTIAAVKNIVRHKDNKGILPWVIEKGQAVYERNIESFRAFYKAGGKIALGTDAGTPFNPHGENALELEYMVEYGMTPLDALIAGTSRAAELCDLPERGRIAPGTEADFLLVAGDPLSDITRAARREHHLGVYRAGVLVNGVERHSAEPRPAIAAAAVL